MGQVWVGGSGAESTWGVINPDLPEAVHPRALAWEAAQQVDLARPGWARRVPLHRLLVEPAPLDPDRFDQEAAQLRRWLGGHGFVEAQVRWELEPLGRRYRGLRFVVELGPPYQVGRSTVAWTGPAGQELVRDVEAELSLPPGIWSEPQALEARERAVDVLHGRGFGRARVELAQVVGEQQVDVHWTVLPGAPCTLGPLELQGEDRHRARRVLASLRSSMRPGVPCNAEASSSLVDLDQGDEQPVQVVGEGDATSLEVRLQERPQGRARPLLRVAGRGRVGTASVGAEGSWTHLGGTGADLSLHGLLGYGLMPSAVLDQSGQLGPVGDAGIQAAVPLWNRAGLVVFGEVGGRSDLIQGTRLLQAEAEAGLRWIPVRGLELEAGYGPRSTLYHPSRGQQLSFEQDFGDEGFTPSSTLLGPRFALRVDSRDQVEAPSRGVFLRWEALPWARWQGVERGRTEAEARAYLPAAEGLVIAARLRGGWLSPGAAEADQPLLQQRFHLGGGRSMRGYGWGTALSQELDLGVEELRPGGGALALAQLEPRFRIVPGLGGSLFVDLGQVWPSLAEVDPSQLAWSFGGGISVHTLLGPVRLQLAWRPGQDSPWPRVAAGLGEAF